jgi:hypothetical protein
MTAVRQPAARRASMKALWLAAAALMVSLAHAAPEIGAPAKTQEAALQKLHADMRRHLYQKGSLAPMPWREAIVIPDDTTLVWGPRAQRWNKGRLSYRVAVDPKTRWYYVVKTDSRGNALYFGPIEETADGSFVDWKRQ